MVLVVQGILSCSKYFFLANISPIVVVTLHMLQQRLQFFPNFNWWLVEKPLEAN
jgi:hypothetical protein